MRHSKLTIPGLRLWVSLGCSQEERAIPQPIDVDIHIHYTTPLPGCQSDQLADTVCYHTLVEWVTEQMKKKSFHLIERVATFIFETVEKHLGNLYRNNLKNREFGKEAPQNFDLERATIAGRQGASENHNFEAKPTPPKTDSSGCFGIDATLEITVTKPHHPIPNVQKVSFTYGGRVSQKSL